MSPHQCTQRLLRRAVPFCSQRVWIREGRVFPMNHNHSWSRPSPLPSPGSHFLICKTRSHGPDPLVEPVDVEEAGGGGRRRPLVARACMGRTREPGACEFQPRTSSVFSSLAQHLVSFEPEILPSVLSLALSSVPPCRGRPLCSDTRTPTLWWAWLTSWAFQPARSRT